ncbi:MAG: hypothetical protein PHY87_04910 [Sphaerochaeta sp.]|nr:hypothetical protein [Sphaerochaeta sp.]
MQPTNYTYAGIDQSGNQYVVCLVDENGRNPHYHQGRSDTKKGQAKCLRLVDEVVKVIAPSTPLGLFLLAHHSEEKIILRGEDEHYAVWEKAGIARGKKMARFASLVLISSLQLPKPLNDKEQEALLAMQGAQMEELLRVGDASRNALMELVAGQEDEHLVQQALRLEVKSRDDTLSGENKQEEAIGVEDDQSFFSQLYRELEKLR